MIGWLLRADGTVPAEIDPTTGRGPEWGKAAPVALLIILLMGIALFFLIKSMNRQLRKVPKSFGAPDPGTPAAGAPGPDAQDTDDDQVEPVDQDGSVTAPPGDELPSDPGSPRPTQA